jgi:hypothetical protein
MATGGGLVDGGCGWPSWWMGTQSKLQLQMPWRMGQWPTGQIVETMGHAMLQTKPGELAHSLTAAG